MSSGFDTLNAFKTDLVIEPVRPVDQVPNVQGGTFEVTEPIGNQEKNQISADLAATAVDQTPVYNDMAIEYADQFLPVRQQMDAQYSAIAERMGLGQRVTFEAALREIEQKLGPLP